MRKRYGAWWEWLIILVIVLVAFSGYGCAGGRPRTVGDVERMAESCRNAGGVWYYYGGLRGRCDYDPLFQQ